MMKVGVASAAVTGDYGGEARTEDNVRRNPSVAFIVPTLRRPEFLKRCLASVMAQSRAPDEILVGVRKDDEISGAVLEYFAKSIPVKRVDAQGTGVIGSMSSCLAMTQCDLIALLDDDVEIPPEWLDTMMAHLKKNVNVVGTAGRDRLQGSAANLSTQNMTADVGRFHWYGKISGNHHRGVGAPRRVDILRGSNCLFRGRFLRDVGFEQRLRGKGAQVHWELALALHAHRRKLRLYYDPTVDVIHHVAPRHDSDQLHRGSFNREALENLFYNEAYILYSYAPIRLKIFVTAWEFIVGGGLTPGLLKILHLALRGEKRIISRVVAFVSGWRAGFWDACRLRNEIRSGL